MSFRLGQSELQHLDPIPFTIDLLKKLRVSDSHLSSLFLIVAELVNNAIDHGLLKLDSTLKEGPDGFDIYLDQRSERLENLGETAALEIEFDHAKPSSDQNQYLIIRVKDTGDGFNYAIALKDIDMGAIRHGRGIGLVNKIANKLEYRGKGNEVFVTYKF